VLIFLFFFQYISCRHRWWACCHWIYDGHINNYILKSQISNVISILPAPYNLWPHTIIFWILKSKIVKHWTERQRSWLGWVQVYRIILNPFQIIVRLSFFTPTLTTRLIQKICANLSHSWRTFVNKANHSKRSDILQIFWIRRVVKLGGQKSQTKYNLKQGVEVMGYKFWIRPCSYYK
jgi:hypothetical protein